MAGHHEGVDVEREEPVYIRTVAGLTPDDVPDVHRVRRAVEIARMAVVVECPTIVQLVDFEDKAVNTYGFGANYPVVTSAWEWGDRVLVEELLAGGYDAAELPGDVAAGVGGALACLHAASLVHSDIAPNNIIRVGGVWKLADLDNIVPEGEPITGLPGDDTYRLAGMDVGKAARREMDEYGLRAVLERIVGTEAT
jgi:hypothetical protein